MKKTTTPTAPDPKYFLPCQRKWIQDNSPLKIIGKSRPVGISHGDGYDSDVKAATRDATFAPALALALSPSASLRLCVKFPHLHASRITFADERCSG
jgi:hypothetical protein